MSVIFSRISLTACLISNIFMRFSINCSRLFLIYLVNVYELLIFFFLRISLLLFRFLPLILALLVSILSLFLSLISLFILRYWFSSFSRLRRSILFFFYRFHYLLFQWFGISWIFSLWGRILFTSRYRIVRNLGDRLIYSWLSGLMMLLRRYLAF